MAKVTTGATSVEYAPSSNPEKLSVAQLETQLKRMKKQNQDYKDAMVGASKKTTDQLKAKANANNTLIGIFKRIIKIKSK